MLINILKQAEKHNLPGKPLVFSGPCPFYVAKKNHEDWDTLTKRPWVIDHPEARDKLWHVVAVESFCIAWIAEGSPIALYVEEWR
jgi:hypothetical protein